MAEQLTGSVAFDRQLLLDAQDAGGAFAASPGFSQYNHCWLRDGSFIAHALALGGELEAAATFHDWVAGTVLLHAEKVEALLALERVPAAHEMLPTRFTLDGAILDDGWPNFQMDGYGQWLWALGEHQALGGRLPDLAGVLLVARYVARFWQQPCFDAWEEGRSQLHTSTLVSCASGLRAAGRLLAAADLLAVADEVEAFVLAECVRNGHLVKQVGAESVDASLLWALTPFGFARGELARTTLDKVRDDLLVDGGVLRYRADTYYGGGAWILLTAWLGWAELETGLHDLALTRWEWIQDQRNADGSLPEQVAVSSTNSWFHDWWTANWGTSASPLMWSHAMSMILGVRLLGRD